MLKQLIVLFFLLQSVFCLDIRYAVGADASSRQSDILYKNSLEVSTADRVLLEGAVNISTLKDVFLNISYENDPGNFFLKFCNIGSNVNPVESITGFKFDLDKLYLYAGGKYSGNNWFPYISLLFKAGRFLPFINFSDRLELGLYYNLEQSPDEFKEYFQIVTPYNEAETNSDELIVKGYYLDTGRIFLNDKELGLRSDGLFQEKVKLDKIGNNDIKFVMRGQNIKYHEHTLTIKRRYPYLDVPDNVQKKWLDLLNRINYPRTNMFNPGHDITRKEFYLYLSRAAGLERVKSSDPASFSDVKESELKEYLAYMQLNGILKNSYKNFYPDQYIKRQEAFSIMGRLLPDKNDYVYNFDDVKENSWLYKEVNKLRNYSIINSSTIMPEKNLTRQEFFNYLTEVANILANTGVAQQPAASRKEPGSSTSWPNLPVAENTESRESLPISSNIVNILFNNVKSDKNISNNYSLNSLNFLTPTKDVRVTSTPFYIKGYGPKAMQFGVNNKTVVINNRKRFAESIELKPGLNSVNITYNDEKRSFNVLYVRKFKDLSANEYFADLLEKILTLGYLDIEDSFYPTRIITRKEIFTALNRLNFVSSKQLENAGEEEVTYKEAANIISKYTGTKVQAEPDKDEKLTRKMFVLMLYEIPKVKAELRKYYNV
ncbi:MAG: hypothetical protein PHV30_08555 [Candidatus Margulisbacteria bacterium]|nr:hypothetical protein [Candidatus Margulisiibacteriota bacterium]